jgi:hypothetical protein
MEAEDSLRDRLWDETWQLRYRTLFVEKAAEMMLNRWLVKDHITRLLVALFTSSSALAGWSLWSSPTGKGTWAILAGIAAVLSIASSTIGTQERVKRFTETHATFVRLRLRLERLLTRMRLDPSFDPSEIQGDFLQFNESYAESCATWPHDIFLTKRLRNRVQDEIDKQQ